MANKKVGIIGAGITGLALALELSERTDWNITVFDKEPSLGLHASGRNSGVIHSGINQKPGSLKAKFCIEGSRLLRSFCQKYGVPFEECGTLVIAHDEFESHGIENLYEIGQACGVPQLKILEKDEIKTYEPSVRACKALLSPTGAIVDSQMLLKTISELAGDNGVKVLLNCRVTAIEKKKITSDQGVFDVDHIVNCAGLFADKLAHMIGAGKDHEIVPFKGEYVVVLGLTIRGMIYQVPDLRFPFLHVHLTRQMDGTVIAGPTASLAWGRENYDRTFDTKEFLKTVGNPVFYRMISKPSFWPMAGKALKVKFSTGQFQSEIEKLVPDVSMDRLKPFRSGIRAQCVRRNGEIENDFVVEFTEHSTHVLNCVSPGLTSIMAFSKYLTGKLKEIV